MHVTRHEFTTEIATLNTANLRGLGKATLILMNSLALPDTFSLDGDMQAVAQMLVPDIADNLAAEDLPSFSGEETSNGYNVAARLPGMVRFYSSLPVVADVSYRVVDTASSTPARMRHSGWALNSATARVTQVRLARYAPRHNTPAHPEMALRAITWAIDQLYKRPLPEEVHWNI